MFKKKYLKYKQKYLELKNQTGGNNISRIQKEVSDFFLGTIVRSNTDSIASAGSATPSAGAGAGSARAGSSKIDALKKCFEYIDPDDKNNTILTFNWPLFYLFDNKINEKFGSSNKVRTTLRTELKLDELFSLDNDNIVEININQHSTIFYKFIHDDRHYIYYSNSGLGIINQVYDASTETTACKIFYFKNIKIWENICKYIKTIIEELIYNLDQINLDEKSLECFTKENQLKQLELEH